MDEEGFFKPKERIVVSEEAKGVMNRKPFSAPVSETKVAGEGLISKPQVATATKPAAGKKKKQYILPSTNLLN